MGTHPFNTPWDEGKHSPCITKYTDYLEEKHLCDWLSAALAAFFIEHFCHLKEPPTVKLWIPKIGCLAGTFSKMNENVTFRKIQLTVWLPTIQFKISSEN